MPTRVSLLFLLLNSKPHKNAFLKVLTLSYVAHNILVAYKIIYFNDDEIPPNERMSTKGLHVTTKCKYYILPRVLINNSSSLNVMKMTTLPWLSVDVYYRNDFLLSTLERSF